MAIFKALKGNNQGLTEAELIKEVFLLLKSKFTPMAERVRRRIRTLRARYYDLIVKNEETHKYIYKEYIQAIASVE